MQQFSRENATGNNANAIEFRAADPSNLTTNPQRMWVNTTSNTVKYSIDGVNVNVLSGGGGNPQGQPYINILFPPNGIPAAPTNGTTDISATLQACVDYASANGGIVYMPYLATGYTISNRITWKSNVGLESEGSLITVPSQSTFLHIFYIYNIVNVRFIGKIRIKSTNDKVRAVGFTGLGSNVEGIYIGGTSQNISIEHIYGENLENVVNMQGVDPATSKNINIKEIESLDSYQPFFVNLFSLVNVDYIHANVVAITMDSHDHIVYTNDKCYDITFGTVQGTSASTVPVWAVQMYPGDVSNAALTSKRVTFNTIKLNGCWSGLVAAMCEGVWVGELTCNLTNGGTILGAYDGSKYEVGNVTVEGNFKNFLTADQGSASFLNQLTIHGGKVNGSIDNVTNNYMVRADWVDKLNINNVEFNNITRTSISFYVPSGTSNVINFTNCLFVFPNNFTNTPFNINAGNVKFKECEFINKGTSYSQVVEHQTPAIVLFFRCTMTLFTSYLYTSGTGTGFVYDSVRIDDNSSINGSTGNELKRLYGTGTPEGVVSARVGSLFFRYDGGASTSMYVKQTGTGNTGWIGK